MNYEIDKMYVVEDSKYINTFLFMENMEIQILILLLF